MSICASIVAQSHLQSCFGCSLVGLYFSFHARTQQTTDSLRCGWLRSPMRQRNHTAIPTGNRTKNLQYSEQTLYHCAMPTWPVGVADERMLAVFDNDSTQHIIQVRTDCEAAVPSPSYKYTGPADQRPSLVPTASQSRVK